MVYQLFCGSMIYFITVEVIILSVLVKSVIDLEMCDSELLNKWAN